jgi:hypothetical protein
MEISSAQFFSRHMPPFYWSRLLRPLRRFWLQLDKNNMMADLIRARFIDFPLQLVEDENTLFLIRSTIPDYNC